MNEACPIQRLLPSGSRQHSYSISAARPGRYGNLTSARGSARNSMSSSSSSAILPGRRGVRCWVWVWKLLECSSRDRRRAPSRKSSHRHLASHQNPPAARKHPASRSASAHRPSALRPGDQKNKQRTQHAHPPARQDAWHAGRVQFRRGGWAARRIIHFSLYLKPLHPQHSPRDLDLLPGVDEVRVEDLRVAHD